MAVLTITSAWMDPSTSLTTGQAYIVQNRSSNWVRFFEADTFNPTTNADDGLVLSPLGHVGQAPNHMKWTFDSGKAVRLKLDSNIGPASLVEFTEAA